MTTAFDEAMDLIWFATADRDEWFAVVTRIDENTGLLTLTRGSTGERVIEQPVPLAYGAMFGPDADDVATWVGICTTWLEANDPHAPIENDN